MFWFTLAILSVQSIHKLQLSSTPSQVTANNYYNVQYYTSLSIGSPFQNLTAIVDTGSYLLWFPSTSTNCKSCQKFNASASSTYKSLDQSHSINYIGGYVEGEFSEDSIKISNLTSKSTQFLLVNSEKNLDQLASDGILGLGYNGKENLKYSLVYNLYLEGQIDEPVFAVDFNGMSKDSFIYIGGYDSEKYDKNEAFIVKVFEDFFSWSGTFNGIQFGEVEIKDYNVVFFDTGLTYFYGPEKYVGMIFDEIKKQFECSESSYLKCECDKYFVNKLPELVFRLDGGELKVGPENYVLYGGGTCTILILKSTYGHWGAGMGFFRSYYSVFNYSDATIAFYSKSEVVESSFLGLKFLMFFAVFGLFYCKIQPKPYAYVRLEELPK